MTDRTRTHKGVNYVVSAAHPAADAFPWLPEEELQELADDIAAHAQTSEVVRLPDGRVIDGRNRELACRIAGVEPQYRTEDLTDDEVITFVISANVHRRNLSVSQRAMAAAELANMRQGERSDLQPSANLRKVDQATAAEQMHVSERSVTSAAKVKDKAPELVEAVKSGDLSVNAAAKVADLPKPARKKVAKAKDKKAAAKDELAKAESKCDADPDADPREGYNAELAALCRSLDGDKAEAKRLAAVSPYGRRIHLDSVVTQIEAARKALWQCRMTEACNCVRDGSAPKAECKACYGCGYCSPASLLRGNK